MPEGQKSDPDIVGSSRAAVISRSDWVRIYLLAGFHSSWALLPLLPARAPQAPRAALNITACLSEGADQMKSNSLASSSPLWYLIPYSLHQKQVKRSSPHLEVRGPGGPCQATCLLDHSLVYTGASHTIWGEKNLFCFILTSTLLITKEFMVRPQCMSPTSQCTSLDLKVNQVFLTFVEGL